MRNKVKWFSPILAVLFFAPWSVTYAQSGNDNITEHDVIQTALTVPSVASDHTKMQDSSYSHSYLIPKIKVCVEGNTGEEFPFRLYVTPEDQEIETLATQISGVEDAYNMAVQWISISDQKLNHVPDKWLTPREFLTNTPYCPSNPVIGKKVSDCEEQAYTLVSLIRAEGIRPEEVRVALGEVKFGDRGMGHAWVELLTDGRWVALDPSCGPYWDDNIGKLVRRRGIPFDYYLSHTYPVVQVWSYYNDIYYFDPRESSGNAPASWRKAATAM